MHLHDSVVIAIWLIVFYAIWAATEAGDPGYGQLSFFIGGLVLTFVLRKLKFENRIDSIKAQAKVREMARDYDSAIEMWESLGEISEAARVRKLKAEEGSVKVDQTVIHGDYIDDRDTIVKDSVINRSNIGGGSSKIQELEKLTEMKEKGLIDDNEFKQMKKEILGK
jgi:hypothetical protein